MVMESILEGPTDFQKKKIGKCSSAKELWFRLEQLYSNKEKEEVMELMLADLTHFQNEKIGKWNSVEELSFKINRLKLDEDHKEEDSPINRSIQDRGKYEGKSPKHSICNSFKEICLSGIEYKSHFEFTEWNTSYRDKNPCPLISDRNLTYTMIDNEITNVSQEVKNLCEKN